jgi:hypothetical protein
MMIEKLVRVLPAVLALALAVHFGMTIIYLMPPNPLKLRLLPTVARYMSPFFRQKWELFAPDPARDNRLLLISCRVQSDGGELRETPYYDITSPLLEQKYRERASAAERIERAEHAGLFMLFRPHDVLLDKLHQQNDETEDYRRSLEDLDADERRADEWGRRLIARAASAECDRIYGAGRTRQVRLRIVSIKTPPLSKRALPLESGESSYTDLDWAPYEQVAAF